MRVVDINIGTILHHQPRNHNYKVLYRTMIKSDQKGKSWEYGWAYQEVDKPESEIYSRPDSLFDSDWSIV